MAWLWLLLISLVGIISVDIISGRYNNSIIPMIIVVKVKSRGKEILVQLILTLILVKVW